MYNDSTFNNLFTGYKSGSDYIYPEGSQNLVVKFANFYLSAKDGDFTTDPVTITSETGEGEDISIGNAPAKVLTATMLNPDGAMDSLTWGDGQVYIGCETATATADTYNSYPVHILAGSVHYGINSSGNARRNSTNYTLGGTPVAVISNAAGNDVLFITDTKIGRYNGSFSTITTPTAEQAYLAAKFRAMPHTVGVLLDANGCPSVYNSVEENTKQTFSYVPMGVFDFSGVDAYGITFGVEAYDKMTVFDADATEWWNSIDFSQGKQLQTLAGEVVSHYGLTLATLPGTAVNKTVSWTTNPITSYAVTGRDLLKWLAEAMGCNVRMGRTGTVEFWTFSSTAVASITPDTIVSSTRVVGGKSVPAVTQTVCYNVLGAGYTATGSTTTGTTYYVVANPFIDPSSNLAPLNAIHGIVTAIPAYYPITIAVSCADARWDAGDFVTITDTDNNSITVPLMHQAMEWNGMCHATLTATGKQVRDIPEGMNNTDLSSMVDSNPSAVVNKIQAVGIDADWITSGTIDASQVTVTNIDADNITSGTIDADVINVTNVTAEKMLVKDTSDRVVFSADSSTHAVKIGAFDVSYTGLGVLSGGREVTVDGSTGTFLSTYNGKIATHNSDYFKAVDNSTHHYSTVTSEGLEIDGSGGTTSLDSSSLDLGSGGIGASLTAAAALTLSKTPNTITVSPPNITFNDSTESSALSVIKRTNSGSSGVATTITIPLERGVYLAITTHTNNSTATQSGLAIVQAYDTNSSVLNIATAGNSTLSVSGLTLSWTVTNTYRVLRLIKLT